MTINTTNENQELQLLPFCFHALSDPIRLNVLKLLFNQKMCVTELCDRLDLQQPKISFHLKILRQSGLVFQQHQGKKIYYSINKSQFYFLQKHLEQYSNFS